jgi:putative glycosyltransferase (TIGR04372 family)
MIPVHFGARLRARLRRAQHEGLVATIAGLLLSVAESMLWLVLLPLTAALHLAGYRRLPVLTQRIGHLAVEVDSFLKQRILGELPHRKYFITAPERRVSNPWLLRYWARHVPVVSHPLACFFLDAMSRWGLMRKDVREYLLRLDQTATAYRIAAAWGARPPILDLTEEDQKWGRDVLRGLGVPDDGWFVAVHVREGGFSPADEAVHRHRNASLHAALPAMRRIVRRGGYCIRMGDSSMTPLPLEQGFIDYAHHAAKSARMDVYLCARTRFFLGNSSGLVFVSAAFGVPSALANSTPMSNFALLARDLSIPKLLWSVPNSRFLRFDEVLDSPAGNFRHASLFDAAGLRLVENSAEEIVALVEEMMDAMEGRSAYAPLDRSRQRACRELLRPGHYSYGTCANIAASFLRAHRDLLPVESAATAESA